MPSVNVSHAQNRAARHQCIVRLVSTQAIRSQAQLLELLAQQGFTLTQATLSRDLDELGAVRLRQGSGPLIYVLPSEGGARQPQLPEAAEHASARLARIAPELLATAEANGNLVVVRTPPGAAQFFASALDAAERPEVMGTIAGDDTVLIVVRAGHTGAALVADLLALAGGEVAA